MQTENRKTEPTPALKPELAAGFATLEKLCSAAEDAEAEAERAELAAAAEPTLQSDAEASVAARKAKLARTTAEKFDRDTLQPLIERDAEARKSAEREDLREQLDLKHVQKIQERFAANVEKLIADTDTDSKELAELLLKRHQHIERATRLGLAVEKLTMAKAIEQIHQRLGQLHSDIPAGRRHVMVGYDESNKTVRIEIQRPIDVHGSVRS